MKNLFKPLLLLLIFTISTIYADSLNSPLKNPSMAITGTQRTATAITDYVIPVAVSGAACNSTTDIVAVTSDHSSQLICQSGTWQPIGGGAYNCTVFNVKASRALNTNYTNPSSNVMFVNVSYTTAGGNTLYAYSNGIQIFGGTNSAFNAYAAISFPVGGGQTYKVVTLNAGSVTTWTECR